MKIKIERLPTGDVRIELTRPDFEKLQEILHCPSHKATCSWGVHGMSIRQAITFALGAHEAQPQQH